MLLWKWTHKSNVECIHISTCSNSIFIFNVFRRNHAGEFDSDTCAINKNGFRGKMARKRSKKLFDTLAAVFWFMNRTSIVQPVQERWRKHQIALKWRSSRQWCFTSPGKQTLHLVYFTQLASYYPLFFKPTANKLIVVILCNWAASSPSTVFFNRAMHIFVHWIFHS